MDHAGPKPDLGGALGRSGLVIPEKLFGIIGASLSHSLSPLLHNWGFGRERLPYAYLTWEIQTDAIPAFMLACRTLPISGLSVTIPHKQAVIPYLDELTEEASATGAVNTLFWDQGRLWGDNTDCRGFLAPLTKEGRMPESALLLGAGGAALACIHALQRHGCQEIRIAARNNEKAAALARRTGLTSLAWEERSRAGAELAVNATPLGTSGSLAGESPLPAYSLSRFETIYDLVYNPLKTVLLKEAESAGCRCISGLDMFVSQGLLQFLRWTGHDLPEEESRKLLLTRLWAASSM